jgi:hypothetical protein
VAALLAAENVALLAEEDRDRLGPLDALTGAPRADDVLLFALPVRLPSPSWLVNPCWLTSDAPVIGGHMAMQSERACPPHELRQAAARTGMIAAGCVMHGQRWPDTLKYAC